MFGFGRLGIAEIIVIALVAIAFIKPEKLKDYMKALKEASKTFGETKKQLEEEAKDIVEPVMDTKEDIESAMKGDL